MKSPNSPGNPAAPVPLGDHDVYEDETTLVNRLYYAVPSFEDGKFHCSFFFGGKHLPQRGKRGADTFDLYTGCGRVSAARSAVWSKKSCRGAGSSFLRVQQSTPLKNYIWAAAAWSRGSRAFSTMA